MKLEEYLAILSALLNNEHITLDGRYYQVNDARLQACQHFNRFRYGVAKGCHGLVNL